MILIGGVDRKIYNTQLKKSRRLKWRNDGICDVCRTNPMDEGFMTCSICREESRQMRYARRHPDKPMPPKPLACPLCDSIPTKFDWHHWDDETPELGMWLCRYCNHIVELEERGLVSKYRRLKAISYLSYFSGVSHD